VPLLKRYRVVVFETVFPIWADQVQGRGGGVAFFPLETSDWSSAVGAIVEEYFHHHIVRSAEVGIAMLDETVLAQFCHRCGDTYWQGGDTP
jgi:hypothetical protein